MVDKPDKPKSDGAQSDKRNRTIDLPAKEVTKTAPEPSDQSPTEPVLAASREPQAGERSKPSAKSTKPNTPPGSSHKSAAKAETSERSSKVARPSTSETTASTGTSKESIKSANTRGAQTNKENKQESKPKPVTSSPEGEVTSGERQQTKPEKARTGETSRPAGQSGTRHAGSEHSRQRSTSFLALFIAALFGGGVALAGGLAALQTGWISMPSSASQTEKVDALAEKVAALESTSDDTRSTSLTDLANRVSALETEVGTIQQSGSQTNNSSSASLESRIAALEARSGTGPGEASSLATMQSQLDQLASSVGELQSTSNDAPTSNSSGDSSADVLSGIQSKLTSLEQSQAQTISDLRSSIDNLQSDIQAAKSQQDEQNQKISGIESEISSLTSRLQSVPDQSSFAALTDQLNEIETTNRVSNAATPVLISDSLLSAVETGQPFPNELAAVSRILPNDTAITVLQPYANRGLPRLVVLEQTFQGLRPELAAGLDASEGGPLQRLIAGAKSVVEIQSSEAIEGSDPFAVTSRISAALQARDLSQVTKEWQALPADRRALSKDWADQIEALAAAEDLAARAREEALSRLSVAPASNTRSSASQGTEPSPSPAAEETNDTNSQ